MLGREWILSVLAVLPVCWWPVFLWDCLRIERYFEAFDRANPGGMMLIGVTRKGRIRITLEVPADGPGEPHRTDFAPRAPWERLEPGLIASAVAASRQSACDRPETGLQSAEDRPVIRPLNLAPG